MQAKSFLAPAIDEIDHDQRVIHGNPGQGKHSKDREIRGSHAHKDVAQQRADDGKGNRQHHEEGLSHRLEWYRQHSVQSEEQNHGAQHCLAPRRLRFRDISRVLIGQIVFAAQFIQSRGDGFGDSNQIDCLIGLLSTTANDFGTVIPFDEGGGLRKVDVGDSIQRHTCATGRTDLELIQRV